MEPQDQTPTPKPEKFPDMGRNQPRIVTGAGGKFVCGYIEWGMLIKFAYESGWRPLGTIEPDNWEEKRNADGTPARWFKNNYFSRFGQKITDEDALSIAVALENSLPDVPDHDAVSHKVAAEIEGAGLGRMRMLRPGVRMNSFEFFSGESKAKLKQFVKFCRAGGFRID